MVFDFIETSAKMNENVFMVFKRLAQFVTECFDPKVVSSSRYHKDVVLTQISDDIIRLCTKERETEVSSKGPTI